jgi:hypothetical protein
MNAPKTITHTHNAMCLVMSATGSFTCIVTLLPLSIMGENPIQGFTPEVYTSMAALSALTPAERATDYAERYGAAVAAAAEGT